MPGRVTRRYAGRRAARVGEELALEREALLRAERADLARRTRLAEDLERVDQPTLAVNPSPRNNPTHAAALSPEAEAKRAARQAKREAAAAEAARLEAKQDSLAVAGANNAEIARTSPEAVSSLAVSPFMTAETQRLALQEYQRGLKRMQGLTEDEIAKRQGYLPGKPYNMTWDEWLALRPTETSGEIPPSWALGPTRFPREATQWDNRHPDLAASGPIKGKGGEFMPERVAIGDPDISDWTLMDLGVEHPYPSSRFRVQSPADEYGNVLSGRGASEEAARAEAAEEAYYRTKRNRSPMAVAQNAWSTLPGAGYTSLGTDTEFRDWWRSALTDYFKNDLGTPNDSVRASIVRGDWLDPDLTEARYIRNSRAALGARNPSDVPPLSAYLGTDYYGDPVNPLADTDFRVRGPEWLLNKPLDTPMWNANSVPFDAESFMSSVHALREPGVPPELALPDEASMKKLTISGAADRVRQYDAWRDQQRQEAFARGEGFGPYSLALGMPDEGMNWFEIGRPNPDANRTVLPPGYSIEHDPDAYDPYRLITPPGVSDENYPFESRDMALARAWEKHDKPAVAAALSEEGNKMGMCIGQDAQGYCNRVLTGDGRVFSLRDAQGKPQVTVLAGNTTPRWDRARSSSIPQGTVLEGLFEDFMEGAGTGTPGKSQDFPAYLQENFPEVHAGYSEIFGPKAWSVEQTKGRLPGQSNPPVQEKYMPALSRLIQSQNWANVGDQSYNSLVRLPGNEWVSRADAARVLQDAKMTHISPDRLESLPSDTWDKLYPHMQPLLNQHPGRGPKSMAVDLLSSRQPLEPEFDLGTTDLGVNPNPAYGPTIDLDTQRAGPDLRNIRLPDGRLVTHAELQAGARNAGGAFRDWDVPENWDDATWRRVEQHYEGFARGGPVRRYAVRMAA